MRRHRRAYTAGPIELWTPASTRPYLWAFGYVRDYSTTWADYSVHGFTVYIPTD